MASDDFHFLSENRLHNYTLDIIVDPGVTIYCCIILPFDLGVPCNYSARVFIVLQPTSYAEKQVSI